MANLDVYVSVFVSPFVIVYWRSIIRCGLPAFLFRLSLLLLLFHVSSKCHFDKPDWAAVFFAICLQWIKCDTCAPFIMLLLVDAATSFAEVKYARFHHIINETFSSRAHFRLLIFVSFVPHQFLCNNNNFSFLRWIGIAERETATAAMTTTLSISRKCVTSANLFDVDGIAYRRWTPNRNFLINHLKCSVFLFRWVAHGKHKNRCGMCIENVALLQFL